MTLPDQWRDADPMNVSHHIDQTFANDSIFVLGKCCPSLLDGLTILNAPVIMANELK